MILELLLFAKEPNMTCLQWKEVVETVEQSDLSEKHKDAFLRKIKVPSRCIKS
jgi:hypothetical protein